MSTKAIKTMEAANRQEWRKWLEEHHYSESEIWLVFYKRHTGVKSISYEDAVEEAICFGWIDSLVKRLDDDRYIQKFTPRKENSRWSTLNRRRYADLQARGLLAEPGLKHAPTSRSGDAPRPAVTTLPSYIQERLQTNPHAWQNFEQLAPSCKREYIGWIDSAKRQETREKRLREAINRLAEGKKLGLK